jgi:phospholipid/cholesterol/gamma-HCH transport system substrate-binding protein
MNSQTLRFRLGVFVLGALLLLAVLIILFGGVPTLFRSFNRYTVVLRDASGVAPGTPVRRAGVRIGEVETIELDDETGQANVEIKVDSRHTLRKDDQPVLTRGLIGGDTSIDFVRRRPKDGKADLTPLEPGTTLTGGSPPEAADLAQQAARLLPPAQEALEAMEKVFNRLDKMMPLMEETLREFRDVAKTGKEAIPTFRATAEDLRLLAKTSREALAEMRRSGEEVQTTARTWNKAGDRFNDFLGRASATFSEENQKNFTEGLRRGNEMLNRANVVMADMQKVSKPLADRTPSILRNLDEGSDRLNKALGDLRELMRITGKADGTLQRLLTDPSLYQHLNEAACMVTRTLPRVDRILQDVEIFADKIARHPEALGLGGVVRPATGLKEAPSGPSYYRVPGH